jgi:hypothetical protein
MNRLTKQITYTMRPAAALIAYAGEEEYRRKEYYLELRNIGNDGLMEAGKPVGRKFVRSLVDSFTVESSSVPHGEIPKKMLYVLRGQKNMSGTVRHAGNTCISTAI